MARSVSVQNAVISGVVPAPKPMLPTMPHHTSSTTKSGVGTGLHHLSKKGRSTVRGSQQPLVRESADS